jgi:hypothetical protein
MTSLQRALRTGAAIAAAPAATLAAAAQAQDAADPAALLAALEPGHYSVVAEGAVTAEAIGLPADESDIMVTDREMETGEEDERLLYTADSWASGAGNRTGPYELSVLLGDAYVDIPGAEAAGLLVGLHLTEAVEPGTYDLDEAFIDVGPGAVPLAVLAAAGAADNSVSLMFSRDLEGTLVLEAIDRTSATGHFVVRALEFEGEEAIVAAVAFNQVPYTPAATVEVTEAAGFSGSASDFDTVSAEAADGETVAIRIGTHPERGPHATIALAEEPEATTYETGAGGPLSLGYNGEPAAGSVTFTRVDGALDGAFVIDASEAGGPRLAGSFDHVRPQ